jgi:hypothetical protein
MFAAPASPAPTIACHRTENGHTLYFVNGSGWVEDLPKESKDEYWRMRHELERCPAPPFFVDRLIAANVNVHQLDQLMFLVEQQIGEITVLRAALPGDLAAEPVESQVSMTDVCEMILAAQQHILHQAAPA